MCRHFADTSVESFRELMSQQELNFSLSIKRLRLYPAIQPRLLVGLLKERLWRGRIPPAEDLASDYTQQDGQQQTGSRAKGGGNSDSHSNPLLNWYGARI